MPGEELPGTSPTDVMTVINSIIVLLLSAVFGKSQLTKMKDRSTAEDNNTSSGNEAIRAQVYKVLKTEHVLDRQSHEDLCIGRIKLVLEKIETQGKAVDGMKSDISKILDRLPLKA